MSIREHLTNSGDCSDRFLWGATAGVSIGDLLRGTSLGGRLLELSGRTVLIATREQLAAASALIELDGVASRVVICPPDIPLAQFPSVIAKSGVDAILSDYEIHDHVCPRGVLRVLASTGITPAESRKAAQRPTDWVLLTSGTTGTPKMILHSLESLTGPIGTTAHRTIDAVWGTFYDIRRYGGLQIFLRAVLGGGSLVLSSAAEPVADHLARLAAHRVTHLSGTPSHWRRVLMSPQAHTISPIYIRLSGEIADQSILNALRSFYPQSVVGQAFASTEAGVAFEVDDGLAGFPASFLGKRGEVEMRVVNDSLQIRSNRTAFRYLDGEYGTLANDEGFVDTGDIVELRADRYYFLGRRNGVINVGGLKVYPEEVEAVINRHPAVRMSVVQSRRNPITGSLVSADVVLKETALKEAAMRATALNEADRQVSPEEKISQFRSEILEMCRQNLAPHKVPASVRCVSALRLAAAGKLVRQHA
jgi:acyl-CoA synthetase (AMP-forming)/AMP-acid ligase II